MKNKQTCLLIFCIAVLGIIVGVGFFEFSKPPRERYREIDFKNHLTWRGNFFIEYQQAIAQNEDWVKDAETVALRVAGYPNIDETTPAKVDIETLEDGRVIITVLSKRLMDDSVARIETRIEFVKDDEAWEIIWAGWKAQCARGSFGRVWGTSPCS